MHLPLSQKKHTNAQTLEPCGRKGEDWGGERVAYHRERGRVTCDGLGEGGAQVGTFPTAHRTQEESARRSEEVESKAVREDRSGDGGGELWGVGGREELGTGRRLAGGSSERRRVRRSRRRRRRRVGWGISRVAGRGEGGERRAVRVGGWKRRPGRRPNPRV
ncbi:hypothetical protein DAI22_02g244000 [Oryza sativa Japonica Group]|nr:hypothetical protein DAI22_02g244000 [Oryza sativa Japonica Group]